MKRRQVTAILLSAVLTVSSCVPLGSISALAAETAGAGGTETAAAAEPGSEESEAAEESAPEDESLPDEEAAVQEDSEPITDEEASNSEVDETQDEETEEESAVTGEDPEEETAAEEAATEETESPEEGTENPPEETAAEDRSESDVKDQYDNVRGVTFGNGADNGLTAYPEGNEGTTEASLQIPEGTSTTLRVTAHAEDEEGLTYQWYTDYPPYGEIVGAESAEFETPTLYGSVFYYCQVKDSYGNTVVVKFNVYADEEDYHEYSLNAHVRGGEEWDNWITQYLQYGESTTLAVDAETDDPDGVTYSWYEITEDGSWLIEGETSAELSIDSVESSKEYECLVSILSNNVSVRFSLRVDNNFEAFLKTGGERNEDYIIYLPAGGTQVFEAGVEANDTTGITYQWYRENREEGYYEPIEGANTAFFTNDPLYSREDYSCTVRDRFGNTSEFYFSLCVENNLRLSCENTDINDGYEVKEYTVKAAPGKPITLRVSASAEDTSKLEYTWKKAINNYEDEDLECNAPEYTTEPVTKRETYHCWVTDQYNNNDYAMIHVVPDTGLAAYAADTGGSCDKTVEVSYGDSVELRVDASVSVGSVHYQWFDKDDNELEDRDEVYRISSVDRSTSYSCTVTDDYGQSTAVYFYVVIQNHLRAYAAGDMVYAYISTAPDEPCTLRVFATADDPSQLTYHWWDDYGYEAESDTGEFTTPEPVTTWKNYYCQVTDQYGNESETVTFEVRADNNILTSKTSTPEGTLREDDYYEVGVPYNEPVVLKVNASCEKGGLSYQWFDNDIEELSSAQTNELRIDHVAGEKYYNCVVTDQYENIVTCYFRVYVDNGLKAYPENNVSRIYVKPGERTELKAIVEAGDKEGMTYNWIRENSDSAELLPVHDDHITVDADTDNYDLYIEDQYGNTAEVHFAVQVVNNLEAYPEGAEVDERGLHIKEKTIECRKDQELDLNVLVSADNSEDLTYEWERQEPWIDYENYYYYDVSTMSGSSSTLTITADRTARYLCRVRDAYGNRDEVIFNVHVDGPLTVYPEGSAVIDGVHSSRIDIAADEGQTQTLHVITEAYEGAALTYEWSVCNDKCEGYLPIETGKSDTFAIDPKEAKQVRCEVTDSSGNAAAAFFYLNTEGLSVSTGFDGTRLVSYHSYEVDVPIEIGEEIDLHPVVNSNAESWTYTYIWEAALSGNITQFTELDNYFMAKGGDASEYRCEVYHPDFGVVYITYRMIVNNELTASPEPTEGLNVVSSDANHMKVFAEDGELIALKVRAEAKVADDLQYTWFDRSGKSVAHGDTFRFKAHGNDSYYCVVKDQYENSRTVYFRTVDSAAEKISLEDAEITLSSETFTYNGGRQWPDVTVVYQGKELELGTDFEVGYGDNWINAGVNKVTIEGIGNCTGTVVKTYTIEKASQNIGCRVSDINVKASQTFDVVGANGAVTVESDNPKVATATASGNKITVTGVSGGTAKLTIKAAGSSNYEAGETTVGVTIRKLAQNPACTVSAVDAKASKVFTVTGSYGAITADTSNHKVATATVSGTKITVKGLAVGKVTLTIKAAGNGIYNAKSVKRTVVVTPAATTSLKAAAAADGKGIKLTWAKVPGATNYLIYRNNKLIKTVGNVVTYTDAAANTNGTRYTFKIIAKAKDIGTSSKSKSVMIYKVDRPAVSSLRNSASRKMTVNWKRNTRATGYQIQYSVKSNFAGAKTVTVNGSATVSKVIGSLTKGKAYYVRIRSCKKVGKLTFYSAWSAKKAVRIAK